jgi:hypothetical protein
MSPRLNSSGRSQRNPQSPGASASAPGTLDDEPSQRQENGDDAHERPALSDLRDQLDHQVRALLRDSPYALLSGAFALGLIIARGWRGRLGRVAVLAAERYLASRAAERFLGP